MCVSLISREPSTTAPPDRNLVQRLGRHNYRSCRNESTQLAYQQRQNYLELEGLLQCVFLRPARDGPSQRRCFWLACSALVEKKCCWPELLYRSYWRWKPSSLTKLLSCCLQPHELQPHYTRIQLTSSAICKVTVSGQFSGKFKINIPLFFLLLTVTPIGRQVFLIPLVTGAEL